MLKKRTWAKVLIIFLFVAAYFIFYAVKFDGERIVSTAPVSHFYLQFNVLNTTDSQNMTFQEGDAMHVSWQIDGGSVDVLIAMQGEEPLYRANGRGNGDAAEFDLTIPKTGDYTVTVTGKNAKGWVRFEEK